MQFNFVTKSIFPQLFRFLVVEEGKKLFPFSKNKATSSQALNLSNSFHHPYGPINSAQMAKMISSRLFSHAFPLAQMEQVVEIETHQTVRQEKFIKNDIENRLNCAQYSANNPIQDAMCSDQLTSINAFAASVFDGHGGTQLAQYCSKHIHRILDNYINTNLKNPEYKENMQLLIQDALISTYEQLQETFYKDIYEKHLKLGNKKLKNVGCCGLTVVVYDNMVYVANCGDCQGIIYKETPTKLYEQQQQGEFIDKEQSTKKSEGDSQVNVSFIACNERANLSNPLERDRLKSQFPNQKDIIVQLGPNNYYLKGRLQPTKTIGDYYLKKKELFKGKGTFSGPYIDCKPQIRKIKIDQTCKYIILASDGIWDVLSQYQLIKTIYRYKELLLGKEQILGENNMKNQQNEVSQVEFQQMKAYLQQLEKGGLSKAIINSCLVKLADMHGKSVAHIKQLQSSTKRNFHDDITVTVIDLQKQI